MTTAKKIRNAHSPLGKNNAHQKLAHDLKVAKYEDGLHNHQGGGTLPLPSTLGWGQHKSRKANVSLFDPFRGGPSCRR
jgi:hypothetical protein